jgi:hypothetical protein
MNIRFQLLENIIAAVQHPFHENRDGHGHNGHGMHVMHIHMDAIGPTRSAPINGPTRTQFPLLMFT